MSVPSVWYISDKSGASLFQTLPMYYPLFMVWYTPSLRYSVMEVYSPTKHIYYGKTNGNH